MLAVAGAVLFLSVLCLLLGGWLRLQGWLDRKIGQASRESSTWGQAFRQVGGWESAASPWLLRAGLVGLCASVVAVMFRD
jgi:hypothetical protein